MNFSKLFTASGEKDSETVRFEFGYMYNGTLMVAYGSDVLYANLERSWNTVYVYLKTEHELPSDVITFIDTDMFAKAAIARYIVGVIGESSTESDIYECLTNLTALLADKDIADVWRQDETILPEHRAQMEAGMYSPTACGVASLHGGCIDIFGANKDTCKEIRDYFASFLPFRPRACAHGTVVDIVGFEDTQFRCEYGCLHSLQRCTILAPTLELPQVKSL